MVGHSLGEEKKGKFELGPDEVGLANRKGNAAWRPGDQTYSLASMIEFLRKSAHAEGRGSSVEGEKTGAITGVGLKSRGKLIHYFFVVKGTDFSRCWKGASSGRIWLQGKRTRNAGDQLGRRYDKRKKKKNQRPFKGGIPPPSDT